MKRLIFATLILSCATAFAGPARPIRSNNFQMQSPCGPPWDSMARQGQWFRDPISLATNVCTWEFHDDTNSITIFGVAQNIQYAPPGTSNSNIMAFDIMVTVSNNLPVDYPNAGNATNSHYEVQLPGHTFYQEGTMFEPRITAEFAVPDLSLVPNGTPPYWLDNGVGSYYIEAVNEEELGWYCWDDPQQPGGLGNFQVPAWRLQPPMIPPSQTGTAIMSFAVTGGGMPISDYRHSVLRYSQWNGADILYNRHTSLKISHWLDTLLVDNGYDMSTPPPPWWEEELEERYIYASDASVFFSTTPPGVTAVLQITPISTNQTPDAIQLDWMATDAVDYSIQYRDVLNTNVWNTVVPSPGIPPVIPSPMQWLDDGTLISPPVWNQPQRFYRLIEL